MSSGRRKPKAAGRESGRSERRLLGACKIALDGLSRMTSEQFANDGDRTVRKALEEAIASSQEERLRRRFAEFLGTAAEVLDEPLAEEAKEILRQMGKEDDDA